MKKPELTSPLSLLVATIAMAAVPYLAVELCDVYFYTIIAISSYLVFHNIAEFFSVMVSFSIFGLGWYAYDQNKDRHSLFLSVAFLGIGLIDFMHTLGYAGMPAFVTPNVTNKATLFWVAVRLYSSVAFLLSAFVVTKSTSRLLTKPLLLTVVLALSGTVFTAVTFFPDVLPAAYIQGVGLTPFKKNTEYVIVLLMAIALAMYWRRLLRSGDQLIRYYLVAFVLCIFSELSFTLYKSAFDTYNMLGHIYKTVAFLVMYRGLFVASVQRPYDDLHQQRNMLSQIINSIPQAVFWKDLHGVYLGCNRVFARQGGVAEPVELIGKNDYAMPWGHESAVMYRADDQEVMTRNKAKYHIIEQLQNAAGETIWIDTTKIPLVNAAGQVSGVLGVFDDITARKRGDEELKQALLFNQQIIDSAQEGIIVYDRELCYRVWNPFMEKITGVPATDVLGKNVLEVFPFLKEAGVMERLATILQGGSSDTIEFAFDIPASGKKGWTEDRSAPLVNAAGDIIGVIGTVRDITESRKTEEQLHQAQKMESIGRLAGGVAHDFNNMLSVIMGNAELALLHIDPRHEVCANLKEIRHSAERSADLTRQLLAFARKQTVAPQLLDLNEAISKILKMLQRLIGEDVHLAWHAASNLWTVKVDPSQIDQILANLCVNARDAIKNSGIITIETENSRIDESYCATNSDAEPGEYVRITVSDNGEGMSPEIMSHIFEPFYTTKELGKGTGLGLATVYGIVRQNKGFINVYSEPGKGAAFAVYLPRSLEISVDHGLADEEIPFPHGTETILLVEDESTILIMTSMMLLKLGYTVLSAASPAEALRIAREFDGELQLLLTDVVMPGMNGKEVAELLHPLYPKMKRLFMSGYTSDVIATQGILAEGTHFIQKPFALAALAHKVREVLD